MPPRFATKLPTERTTNGTEDLLQITLLLEGFFRWLLICSEKTIWIRRFTSDLHSNVQVFSLYSGATLFNFIAQSLRVIFCWPVTLIHRLLFAFQSLQSAQRSGIGYEQPYLLQGVGGGGGGGERSNVHLKYRPPPPPPTPHPLPKKKRSNVSQCIKMLRWWLWWIRSSGELFAQSATSYILHIFDLFTLNFELIRTELTIWRSP